jgi:hypothetical protein
MQKNVRLQGVLTSDPQALQTLDPEKWYLYYWFWVDEDTLQYIIWISILPLQD